MTFTSTNPATGEVLATFPPLSAAELDARLDQATAAWAAYRRTPLAARAAWLQAAAQLLEAEKAQLGRTMTLEMGKPIGQAIAEAEKCALACRYYADHAAAFLAPERVDLGASWASVRYEPLGPILAIMPWNFPFWQVIRFGAPALMAGNVMLVKHAPGTPQCALALEDLFRRAGFPAGVLQNLFVDTDAIQQIIADPRVAAVTLTGSDRAGAAVASAAGRAVKKAVLELGGSDPFVVLDGADVAAAADTAVRARTINSGQSCVAAKRFIVVEALADAFTERFVAGMAALRVGDPLDPQTEVGPLAAPALLDNLERQVRDCVAAGATLLTGGARVEGPGCFFQPTVIANLPQTAPVYREELFGPVALVFRARSVEAALAIANDTPYGLAASVWTDDPALQARCSEELACGAVFFNTMVASDPRLPFGGVKRSGYGRELGSWGIREFVNVKALVGAASPSSAVE